MAQVPENIFSFYHFLFLILQNNIVAQSQPRGQNTEKWEKSLSREVGKNGRDAEISWAAAGRSRDERGGRAELEKSDKDYIKYWVQ